ncbi:MAG TPA: CDP-diacylglycerol--glycerol-3-phosphate 3-phosphatidyltransferase [Planctomycetota bacterium]|nr:CDP-diacylglycerol--glycerol-3-phosphate 3-phosphatidyltransferase [Planctomycetota bacterium]
MSVPNLLTLFRLCSAPVFLALFIGTGEGGFLKDVMSKQAGLWACLVVLSLSELSDVLDGILARRLNQVSDFGKLLDPYADSTFRLSCFFAFASHAHGKWIPLWMVMILFYRDLLVTVIRTFGVEQRVFVHARASGKIKAIAQGTVVFVTLAVAAIYGEEYVSYESATQGSTVSSLAKTLMWVVTLVTAWSGIDYFVANRHLFSSAQSSSNQSPPQN